MASPASIAKHPLHPILVALPIGLWVFSLVSDVIYLMGWGGPVWKEVALYTMAGGIGGALLAAIPGFIDLLSMSKGRVRSMGIWHMSINLFLVALYSLNFWLRESAPGSRLPFWLSVIAVGLLGISGWLGGEMVYVHGVAVEPESRTTQSPSERMAARRVA